MFSQASAHGRGVYPSIQWVGVCVSQHAMGQGGVEDIIPKTS